MPSDDIQLCSAIGARHGMAPKVLCAFPAARRHRCHRGMLILSSRNTDLENHSRDRVRVSKGSTRLGTGRASF